MKDFICKCGHRKEEHGWRSWPEACSVDDPDEDGQHHCYCVKFVPDNLKYLEELYESRTRRA
jgi:hypothetical protein